MEDPISSAAYWWYHILHLHWTEQCSQVVWILWFGESQQTRSSFLVHSLLAASPCFANKTTRVTTIFIQRRLSQPCCAVLCFIGLWKNRINGKRKRNGIGDDCSTVNSFHIWWRSLFPQWSRGLRLCRGPPSMGRRDNVIAEGPVNICLGRVLLYSKTRFCS